MRVFGIVELQGPADSVDDLLRYPGRVAALEALVVLGTHSGDEGDLFSAQPRHSTTTAEVGQPDLLGGELGTPRREELADGVVGLHANDGTPIRSVERGPVGAPIAGATLTRAEER